VRRQFAPGTGNSLTNEVVGTAGSAVSEFAFNKLNNLISQSNIKNVDLNIRSFNDASASVRLFNERLRLNGSLFNNAGSGDLFNNTSSLISSGFSSLTKDFEASYLIRPDGNLTARYSYRVLNTTTLSNYLGQFNAQYVNGLGLVYQRDFDTFGEFIRNLFRRGGTTRRNNAPAAPANTEVSILPDSLKKSNNNNDEPD